MTLLSFLSTSFFSSQLALIFFLPPLYSLLTDGQQLAFSLPFSHFLILFRSFFLLTLSLSPSPSLTLLSLSLTPIEPAQQNKQPAKHMLKDINSFTSSNGTIACIYAIAGQHAYVDDQQYESVLFLAF